jgi:protein-L-isoaspartate(D-aspartate) O-methyltransferase
MRSSHLTQAILLLILAGACGAPEPIPGNKSFEGQGEVLGSQVRDSLGLLALREQMVNLQIEARGVRDAGVLRAMRKVPRHSFVPEASPAQAYGDWPLRIGHGQTISQPYIVAYMAEAADISAPDRVLEIGTGSGYGAAVLAELASEVYTVEIVPELAERARTVLDRLGYENVEVRTGNGWLGWPEHAPYDAVVVTAAPDEVPPNLVTQLKVGGTLVVPVGDFFQMLRVLRKTPRGMVEEASLPVRFVPMVRIGPDTGG